VDVAALEECVLLASTGVARSSAADEWAAFRARVEGEAEARGALAEIARAGASLASALGAGRLGEAPRLIAAEWEAQKRLTPGVASPEIDRLAALAAECGGAARRCGGGGVVALWAAPGERGPGPRERLVPALKRAGVAAFPFRADLQGLEVELE
jgi:galactokinase/mevalonate kinase-like predicted kinase